MISISLVETPLQPCYAKGMPALTLRSRPRRGRPEETRTRLIAAAATEFNRLGFHGTDSNRLARAAGYAPGTFYKHFPDKRALFLAVYADWVTREWAEVGAIVQAGGTPKAVAAAVVAHVLALHRRWRGMRASLRALVVADADARAFYRAQRRRQLALFAALRGDTPPTAGGRVEDAMLLYTLERVCDAAADGELRDLGLAVPEVTRWLEARVAARVAMLPGAPVD